MIILTCRVGQRVRFLHDSGEGVISGLVDKQHVEVDMGDDFPMEVHISEVIPVAEEETICKPEETATSTAPPPPSIISLS